NLLSWGPPPLSILEWRLSRSFRSRCDCDHKKAFFHLGPAVRGAREKITFLKWVRGVFPGKNRSRKRGLIGANYGGDFSGALAAMPGLVALAMCRQGPLASPAVQAAGACAARSREGGSPLGFAVEDRLVLHAIVAREPAHQRTVHPIVEHPAHIFARNACHGGEVALGHFLPDEDAPLSEVMPERLGEVQ